MTRPRFIQVHSLASYPGTLLNRDDTGQAKRLPFGGVTRARVSSQALKRKWRFAGEVDHEAAKRVPHSLQGLQVPMGSRSRVVVEGEVMPKALVGLPALHPEVAGALVDRLNEELYGDSGSDKKKRQALFFGWPEMNELVRQTKLLAEKLLMRTDCIANAPPIGKAALKEINALIKSELKPVRTNLRELGKATIGAAGLESAMFGRMVTSDIKSNVDAPVHVAHAFTVHSIERVLDFVSAVDDLGKDSDDKGAGMFDIELTSGLFYSYVVVDVGLLVSNLNGEATLAAGVCERLLELIAYTSPGAKKGSTAPYARSEFMLVESGNEQPRTLANAFRTAIDLHEPQLFEATMRALTDHLANLDRSYGVKCKRRQMSVTPPGLPEVETMSLADLCAAIRQEIEQPAA